MHIVFVHQNYPAQFGHIAHRLTRQHGVRCTFVSRLEEREIHGIQRLQYRLPEGHRRGAPGTGRSFEGTVAHARAVHQALAAHPGIRPDLIVGHSGFGSTLFLRDLYDCPIINYFEYFYGVPETDYDFRPPGKTGAEPPQPARLRNAMILLDLNNCTRGYSPTLWQRSLIPAEYQHKLEHLHDGVDTRLWRRHPAPRRWRDLEISPGTRIVTYVSRGFESMRGFDVFMKVAKRIYRARPDVIFLCVGSDKVHYGSDLKHTGGRSYREHVLASDEFDRSRFVFTGHVPPRELAQILSLSDLHLYLTKPFVLSWSMLDAMACGCTVLASDVAPVRELIDHGQTGLLAGFFDVEEMARLALEVLDDPETYRRTIGARAAQLIQEQYSLDVQLPRLRRFYEETASGRWVNPMPPIPQPFIKRG